MISTLWAASLFTLRKMAIRSSLCGVLRILHNCCDMGNPFWGKDN
jgi:hypothetical protein